MKGKPWQQAGQGVQAMTQAALFWILLVCLLVFMPAAHAVDTTLLATVTYYPNGSATVDDLEVSVGQSDEQPLHWLQDSIRLSQQGIALFDAYVPVTFFLLDANVPMPKYTVTRRLPYMGNVGSLEAVADSKSTDKVELAVLCNNDKKCAGFENSISCPGDCPVSIADGVCLARNDGQCDPDCAAKLDLDCLRNVSAVPAPESRLEPFLVAALLLVAVGVGFLLARRKKR